RKLLTGEPYAGEPPVRFGGKGDQIRFPLPLSISSYLLDPFSNGYGLFRRIQVIDALHPKSFKIVNFVRKIFLALEILFLELGSIITTPLGIATKNLACYLHPKPFHFLGNLKPKAISDNFSLRSSNLCGSDPAHCITDGGVMPWPFRIDHWIKKIREKSEDIVCLFEIFDIQIAEKLKNELKDKYAHFFFNMGPKVLGINSGIFVACKFDVLDFNFSPFPKNALVGRTKNVEKGFFRFETSNAIIYASHLQHSEAPEHPTDEEIKARKVEMDIILDDMKKHIGDKPIILTGDLNLDDSEYNNSSWKKYFQRIPPAENYPSWGGDEFCAKLVGKNPSGPINLDYTLLLIKNPATEQAINVGKILSTSLEQDGFNPKIFQDDPTIISDHKALCSEISRV
ncbi:MAG: hypothetical protein HZB76_01185, partial [Chlamydiae bacterium]|nr:hypothetical protein [Chlamydiota bacterium]